MAAAVFSFSDAVALFLSTQGTLLEATTDVDPATKKDYPVLIKYHIEIISLINANNEEAGNKVVYNAENLEIIQLDKEYISIHRLQNPNLERITSLLLETEAEELIANCVDGSKPTKIKTGNLNLDVSATLWKICELPKVSMISRIKYAYKSFNKKTPKVLKLQFGQTSTTSTQVNPTFILNSQSGSNAKGSLTLQINPMPKPDVVQTRHYLSHCNTSNESEYQVILDGVTYYFRCTSQGWNFIDLVVYVESIPVFSEIYKPKVSNTAARSIGYSVPCQADGVSLEVNDSDKIAMSTARIGIFIDCKRARRIV